MIIVTKDYLSLVKLHLQKYTKPSTNEHFYAPLGIYDGLFHYNCER